MEQKNQVVPFEFQGSSIRTINQEGELLFVAKDVCDVLGYVNHNDAISKHCKGVAKHYPLMTAGGIQNVRVIREPDLYRLIMGSRLPEAEKFERWVTEEVLPAIRKTGGYRIPKPATIVPIDREFRAALRMAKAAGLVKNQAVLSASALTRKLTGADPLVLLDATHLIAEVQERHYTATGLGELLGGKGAREINELLHNRGLQVPVRIGKQKIWKPTAKGRRFAVLVDTGKRHHGGSMIQQVRWLESVVSEIGGRA